MAASGLFFGLFFVKSMNEEVDFESDTIKCALMTDSYTPNQDTDTYFADISANEVSDSGTGYTAGGCTLTNPTLTYTGATNVLKFDADNALWGELTLTARYAVVYDSTPANKPLIALIDLGENKTPSGEPFAINWSADGIAKITVD